MQWHPLLAAILRPTLEKYYKVSTNFPVGDLPREADIVILQRLASAAPPFSGFFKLLTQWNIVEFKGLTVSPRRRDLDLLIEVGLGVDRRLNELAHATREASVSPNEVSFWFLANRLGKRILPYWKSRLGRLELQEPGVWRSQILDHPIFLVSGVDLPVHPESVPIHLVAKETTEKQVELGQLLANRPDLWRQFGEWFAYLHPTAWKEVKRMGRARTKDLKPDLGPLIDYMGIDEAVKQMGPKKVIEAIGMKRVLDELGVDELLRVLSPQQRETIRQRLK